MADYDGETDVFDISENGKGVALNVWPRDNRIPVVTDPVPLDSVVLNQGELVYAKNTERLRVGDGYTPGGDEIAFTSDLDDLVINIGDVVGLEFALDSKANVVHTHAISDVTGLQPALDAKADVSALANYLPLTGGTLTGPLFISDGGTVAAKFTSTGPWLLQDCDVFNWRSAAGGSALILYTSGNPLMFLQGAANTAPRFRMEGQNPSLELIGDANSYYTSIQIKTIHGTAIISGYGGLNHDVATGLGHVFQVNAVTVATINATGINLPTGATYKINGVPIGGGGGLTDGDKGDVVVSGGGTVLTVESTNGDLRVGSGYLSLRTGGPAGAEQGHIYASSGEMSYRGIQHNFHNQGGTVGYGNISVGGIYVTGFSSTFGQATSLTARDADINIRNTYYYGHINFYSTATDGSAQTLDAHLLSYRGFGLIIEGSGTVRINAPTGVTCAEFSTAGLDLAAGKALTVNGSAVALVSQLANYLPLTGGTLAGPGNLNVNGGMYVGSPAGSPAADASITIRSTNFYSILNFESASGSGGAMVNYGSIWGQGLFRFDGHYLENKTGATRYATIDGSGLELRGAFFAGPTASAGYGFRAAEQSGTVYLDNQKPNIGFGYDINYRASRQHIFQVHSSGAPAGSLDTDALVINATGLQLPAGKTITIGGVPIGDPYLNTSTSNATLTPVGTDDMSIRTTQIINLTIAAPSGTPVNGFGHVLRIKATAAIATVTWNAIYRAIGVTLPLSLVNGKTTYIGMIYNALDTKWDVVSVATEA